MRWLWTFAAFLSVLAPGGGQAAPAVGDPVTPPSNAAASLSRDPLSSPLTPDDVSAWLDGFMPHALAAGDIAGAQVAVVRNGQILALKGYGYADVERRVPVDPRKHLFRPGSIAKLFTWIAVMQLVEKGRIDLDADINSYLDFRIPARADGPITMRHLMTHTPGFEDAVRALITPDPANVGLERTLKRWVPKRVYAAGSTPAYSNYGTGLAGYIVQRVSGMSFDQYVERRIFEPLQMADSTFRQPLPRALSQRMTKAYLTASGDPMPYEYVSLPPAGSLATSAADMAKFMIAMLDGGTPSLLRPETLRLMQRTRAPGFPRINTMLLGFFENDLNGRKVIAHSGDTTLFHSELNLFIDDGVGLYVSLNSLGSDAASVDIRTALVRAFADRYFPGRPRSPGAAPDADTAAAHAALIAGRYDNARRSRTSFLAGLSLLGQASIVDNGDGTIGFPAMTDFAGNPKRWREIAPFLWQEVGGPERLSAEVVDGKVVRIGHSAYPYMVWDRAPWWRDTAWLLPLTQLAMLVLVLTVILWPVSAMIRRKFDARLALAGRARLRHRGVRFSAIAVLASLLLWALLIQTLTNNLAPGPLFDGEVMLATVLTLVGALAGLVFAGWTLVAARRERRGWQSYLGNSLLIVAFGTFLWIGFAFNLFAFSTQF